MDLICQHCGSPWDMYELSEIPGDRAGETFQALGCGAFQTPPTLCRQPRPERGTGLATRANAASALYEVLGPDLDGAAAMLEDAEAWGMFDEDQGVSE